MTTTNGAEEVGAIIESGDLREEQEGLGLDDHQSGLDPDQPLHHART